MWKDNRTRLFAFICPICFIWLPWKDFFAEMQHTKFFFLDQTFLTKMFILFYVSIIIWIITNCLVLTLYAFYSDSLEPHWYIFR